MPNVSVIIPVFNQATLTERCLQTVKRDGLELVVVDDASTDATPELLNSFKGQLKIVTHACNQGFARSCNDGAALGSGEYLIFLNNDTVPRKGWLESFVRYARNQPQAAAIGARMLYPNNTIQHAGVVICQDRYPRHIYAGFPAEHPAVIKSRRFQIVTAACLLVRRDAFESIGGFDAQFRNGFEDVDLCLRLGRAGYEIHYCAESVVEHLESVSEGRFKHDRNNVALYRQRSIEHVQSDDLNYYIQDGLLRLEYEGRYPVHLEVSPLLATVEQTRHVAEAGRLARERAEQVAELVRENSRLRVELGSQQQESTQSAYIALRQRIGRVVREAVPANATVLVITKGDSSLLESIGTRARHFPQTGRGAYAGHHPADSREAITHLDNLRAHGAEYLVVPAPSAWWLDHYVEFRQHLDEHCTKLPSSDEVCCIFDLRAAVSPELLTHCPKRL